LVTLFLRKRKKENEEEEEGSDVVSAVKTEDAVKTEGEADTEEEEPETLRQRLIRLKVPALLTGIIPGILFLILENIRLPITWITQWTPLIGAFFILHMVLLLIQYIIKSKAKTEDEKENEEDKTGAEVLAAAVVDTASNEDGLPVQP